MEVFLERVGPFLPTRIFGKGLHQAVGPKKNLKPKKMRKVQKEQKFIFFKITHASSIFQKETKKFLFTNSFISFIKKTKKKQKLSKIHAYIMHFVAIFLLGGSVTAIFT